MPAVPKSSREAVYLLGRSFNSFIDDDCLDLGASVAYFSVFSLAPLLLTVVAVAGLFYGRVAVQDRIHLQMESLVGTLAADQVQLMLQNQAKSESTSLIMSMIGVTILLFGATGCFAALQNALNRVWHVKPNPKIGGVRAFLVKRLWSFGMILALVFLMIVSLVLGAALAALGDWARAFLPAGLSTTLLQIAGTTVSVVVLTLLFGAMFRVLPDAKIAWRDVWFGGLITSILFTTGQTALAIYLGRSALVSVYGAAGSLMLIVLWLYYTSLIVLFGAEWTRAWAITHGRYVEPEPGAVEVVTTEHVRPASKTAP
ncbi:MAG: YihY/virulence factor BrkB family protein, partial [Acidobacteriota bacterium]